jgi:MFS transporter, DHA1 family, tetracycline resistance protein
VLGPYLGGRLSAAGVPFIKAFGIEAFKTPSWFNPSTPFFFAAIIAFLNTLLVIFVLPETLKKATHFKLKVMQSFINIREGLRMDGVKTLLPVNFLFSAGFTFFTTFFGFTMIKRISGFTPTNVADYFSLIGIWIAVFQAILVPRLAKKFKSYQVLRFSLFGTALALPLVLLASTTTQAIGISPFIPLFVALTMANSISLLSSVADPRKQGEVMGINSSFEALAQGIPAIISGYVATIAIGLPTLVGSSLIILGGILFWSTFKPKKLALEQTS